MSKFRESVVGRYELRPDEVELVEAVAATDRMIDALQEAWLSAGCPMMTSGSMGQEVIHPLVGELRAQRAAKARLMAQLKLPDEPAGEGDGTGASTGARKAATARWSRGA